MDSLALALRGSFRPEKARGPRRLYELRVDGKSLRVEVDRGQVSVPAASAKEPDLVVEADAGVLSELPTGRLDVEAATNDGRVRLDGDRADATRLFEMFRLP